MRLDILKKKEKKDLGKVKERSKDSDRSRDKPRDSDKEKDKKKGKDKSSKSPWAHLYGTIDAKKAVQGTGLNKFKIPKKRPSIEAQPEQSDSPEPVNFYYNTKFTTKILFNNSFYQPSISYEISEY